MKVELIDFMGTDLSVVNSARVSFDKTSEFANVDNDLHVRDEKLIKFLARHNHFTPFTHATITLRETVPIFVARQRFKHTVGFSYNEISRRYVDHEPEFYFPDAWRSRPEGSVKQGSGGRHVDTDKWTEIYKRHMSNAKDIYEVMVEDGIAPEQARMVLPQSMYTSYYVTGSLYAFAHAYMLRADENAQKEIQDLAQQWKAWIAPLFPVSWGALTNELPN